MKKDFSEDEGGSESGSDGLEGHRGGRAPDGGRETVVEGVDSSDEDGGDTYLNPKPTRWLFFWMDEDDSMYYPEDPEDEVPVVAVFGAWRSESKRVTLNALSPSGPRISHCPAHERPVRPGLALLRALMVHVQPASYGIHGKDQETVASSKLQRWVSGDGVDPGRGRYRPQSRRNRTPEPTT